MSFIRDWNDFWFRPISARPLGLFRILIGLVLIAWCLLLMPDLMTWYSQSGVLPLRAMDVRPEVAHGLNVIRYNTSPAVIWALFTLMLACAVSFTVGFCTKASNILLFLCLLSFTHRNSIMLNSGDTLLRLNLFYLIFANSGAALSIDRTIRVREGEERADEIPMIEPWAQRLIQIQLSIIYLSTFLWKMQGTRWQNGTALWYPLHMSEMVRFPLPWVSENIVCINLLTWGTLMIELSLATLIWVPRFRKYVLLCGTMLHLGIEYTLNIPLFSFAMISNYVTFFPDSWAMRVVNTVTALTKRRPKPAPDSPSDALIAEKPSANNV